MRNGVFLIGQSPPQMRNGLFQIRVSQSPMRNRVFRIEENPPQMRNTLFQIRESQTQMRNELFLIRENALQVRNSLREFRRSCKSERHCRHLWEPAPFYASTGTPYKADDPGQFFGSSGPRFGVLLLGPRSLRLA